MTVAGLLYGGVTSILKRDANTKFILYAAGDKGLQAFEFDAADASSRPLGVVAEITGVSFLAVHRENRLLYSVNGAKEGTLSAFAINPKSGALRLLNTVPSLGENPCHVGLESNGWMILVTNCGSGSVASFRVGGDGSILESPTLTKHSDPKLTPHPAAMAVSPDNLFLFVPDAGLDKIFFYRFEAARVTFWPNTPAFVTVKAGSGPRRLAFRPDERFAYAVDETSSKITAFKYDRIPGTLAALDDVSTLPDGFAGKNGASEIEIDTGGKFLYASNRGDDSIVVFSIKGKSGELTKVQRISTQGKSPEEFKIDPTGRYLLAANRDSGTVVIFEIDRKTGMLSGTGKVLEVPSPSCLRFVPAA